MALTRLILRRLLLGVVTLFVVSLVVFLATRALPSDAARAILGRSATPESLAQLRHELGLDQPMIAQYWTWLGDTLRGDLGNSLSATHYPVSGLLRERIVNSAALVLLAAAVSLPLSLLLGAYSAFRRDTKRDAAISLASIGLAAVPEFIIGVAVILLLSTQVLHLFPAVSLPETGVPITSQLSILVLPVLALTLGVLPYVSRLMRASTVEVLESDYVTMARLKGGPERTIMLRHVVPNAVIPAVQASAMQFAWLAGGIVVIEYLFAYPGIGGALVGAIANRDLPVIQAVVLLIAAVYVVMNLIADVITILLSPRLRTGMR